MLGVANIFIGLSRDRRCFGKVLSVARVFLWKSRIQHELRMRISSPVA